MSGTHGFETKAISGLTAEEMSAFSGRIVSPGVPPKSKKEAKEHIEAIRQLQIYERKLMEQEAVMNRKRREIHNKAIENFSTVGIPAFKSSRAWPEETVALWARHGIPAELRGKVWEMAIDNPHDITKRMYDLCRRKAEERRHHNASGGSGDPEHHEKLEGTQFSPMTSKLESANMIGVDLPRTFVMPSNTTDSGRASPLGASGRASPHGHQSPRMRSRTPSGNMDEIELEDDSPGSSLAPPPPVPHPVHDRTHSTASVTSLNGQSPLTKEANANPQSLASSALLISRFNNDELLERLNMTLRAFVEFRPDVGYVQGMSYVAAMLLMQMEEHQAFVGLATLMTKGHFPYFYTVNHTGMAAHMQLFEEVLRIGCPELQRALTIIGVNPQMYVIDWWMSLFSRTLPFEIAVRCWDLYLLDPAYLYRISQGILMYFESFFGEDTPLDEAMQFLQRVQKSYIEEEKLFSIIASCEMGCGPSLNRIHTLMDSYLGQLTLEADETDAL